MKKITNKFGKFVKNKILKPAVITAGILASAYGVKAQDIWENPEIKAAMNFYSQPNLHIVNGKDSLDYYGSGDVNLDKTVNYLDAEAIRNSTHNIMGDVNGDSIQGDEADAQMIENYLAGNISYLPGKDYNHLNRSEKIDWIKKMLRIDDSNEQYAPGEVCVDYVSRGTYHFRGGGDSEGFDDPNVAFNPEALGRFNIPTFFGLTKLETVTGPINHALLVFYVGREERYSGTPTKLEDYVAFDIQNRSGDLEIEEIQPGSLRMRDYLKIQVITKYNNYLPIQLITFQFPNNDGNYTVEVDPFFEDHLIMENPNRPDTIAPGYTPSEDTNIDYNEFKEKGLVQIIEENNPSDVIDNIDSNPETSYTYMTNQTNNQSYTDFNFDTEIEFKASDDSGNDSISKYNLFVRDNDEPEYTYFPMNANILSNESMEPSVLGFPEAIDNTDANVDITYNDELKNEDNLYKYFERKWTATDISGLKNDSIQYITQQKPTGFDNNLIQINKGFDLFVQNPFANNLVITTHYGGLINLKVITLTGEAIKETKFNSIIGENHFEVNLNSLQSGFYLIVIKDISGHSDIKKVVIN